jgi:hypothetical protein
MESRLAEPHAYGKALHAVGKYSGPKEWLGSKFRKNTELFVIGGISAAVALVAVVSFAIYRKKRASEGDGK